MPRWSEPRHAIPLYPAHGPRALSDIPVHGIRRHRRACICTPDILIHSTIHTDYIIGLCRADRPSNCPSNGPVHVARSDAVYPIEITRFNMDDSGGSLPVKPDSSLLAPTIRRGLARRRGLKEPRCPRSNQLFSTDWDARLFYVLFFCTLYVRFFFFLLLTRRVFGMILGLGSPLGED